MDFTNRIKDCTVDIGAYEADNTANITAQEKRTAKVRLKPTFTT